MRTIISFGGFDPRAHIWRFVHCPGDICRCQPHMDFSHEDTYIRSLLIARPSLRFKLHVNWAFDVKFSSCIVYRFVLFSESGWTHISMADYSSTHYFFPDFWVSMFNSDIRLCWSIQLDNFGSSQQQPLRSSSNWSRLACSANRTRLLHIIVHGCFKFMSRWDQQ